MKDAILKNRFTLLLSVLLVYVLVLVVEGAITGREGTLFDFENPFFEIRINNLEDFQERQSDRQSDRRDRARD
jgi:hypothetical protein